MKTVTKTALANVRQNKGRNILSGIAIGLTTFLIFVILTVGFGVISLERGAINEFYPTWHVVLRKVSVQGVEALKVYDDIESLGLRIDVGESINKDADIILQAMDETAIRLNKVELEKGEFPIREEDIVVSEGLLEAIGQQGDIGDEITLPYQLYEKNGLGYEQVQTFRICGFIKSNEANIEEQLYGAMVSVEFAENIIPESDLVYQVLLRLADTGGMTTDDIMNRGKEIGADIGVEEYNVEDNREYLYVNYTDPSIVAGIALIVLVIVCAGILTIYSIFYVSMIPKVQEYGKLKAMGATKRQIRQIVCREGLVVMLIAMPVGLVVSSVAAKAITRFMFRYGDSSQDYTQICLRLLETGEVPVLRLWIYALTIAIVFAAVVISLWKPMNTAAKISPVEAMRYEGERAGKKKSRKGYSELNLMKLTKANLLRNKRRTAITIATLGIIGILYLVIATIISCAQPKEISRSLIDKDYRIKIDSWSDDKMNPDREWWKIQQNNPMDDAFLQQVREVPGVEAVETKTAIEGAIPDIVLEGEALSVEVAGLDEVYADALERGIYDGNITYEELKKGDKVVMNDVILHWAPELKVGDSVQMELEVGDDRISRTFEIAAMGKYGSGFSGMDFILPKSVLQEISPYNLNFICEIEVQEEQKETAYPMLQSLADSTGYMRTESFEGILDEWERSMDMISVVSYTLLIVIGGIGLMNLTNTMINSIYMRKRELGMMQAIGLSEGQLIRMLQLEGMFYTIGTLIISVGLGSMAGYAAYLWARKDGMFSIQFYHYPVIQVLILVAAVALVQIFLTYFITRNFRKSSLIERVRYSE